MRMESRIHVITLAVSDLDRALAFYRDGLGLDSAGVIGTEFVGSDGARRETSRCSTSTGTSFLLCTRARSWRKMRAYRWAGAVRRVQHRTSRCSKQDVDALLTQAEAAGATLTGPAHDRPWGIYSGYFRDLDGHLWEIIWNPRA